MYGINLTILIALGFAALVIIGNVIYCKGNKQPINWNRGWIIGGASAIIIFLIGWLSE